MEYGHCARCGEKKEEIVPNLLYVSFWLVWRYVDHLAVCEALVRHVRRLPDAFHAPRFPDLFTCCVCFEEFDESVYQCEHGHMLCGTCHQAVLQQQRRSARPHTPCSTEHTPVSILEITTFSTSYVAGGNTIAHG